MFGIRTVVKGALGFGIALAALYVLIVAMAYWQQRALLYPAPPAFGSFAEARLEGFRELSLTTQDGERIPVWWKPPEPGRALVIYFHGNGGSLFGLRERARLLSEGGRGILLVTYRGYPGATGVPSEAGLAEDARAGYAFAASRYEGRRLVLYGESLGTGVAVRLATERPVGGLVLDAPFTSVVSVAARAFWFLPVRLLMRDRYESIERIGALKAPLLVLHGERDGVVPIEEGERLFAAAPEPKRFVRLSGGHNGNLEGVLAEVRAFLDRVEAGLAP